MILWLHDSEWVRIHRMRFQRGTRQQRGCMYKERHVLEQSKVKQQDVAELG